MTGRFWLLCLWVVTGLLNLWLALQPDRRSLRWLPEMDDTATLPTFAASATLPGGRVLQAPPPGTLPAGASPLPYAPTAADAARAGRELRNPLVGDPQIQALGRNLFRDFCTPCHGVEADGQGLVPQRGFPAPPSLPADSARQLPDGAIFHLLTFGRNNMPPYRWQLSERERWAVILYVRELQRASRQGQRP